MHSHIIISYFGSSQLFLRWTINNRCLQSINKLNDRKIDLSLIDWLIDWLTVIMCEDRIANRNTLSHCDKELLLRYFPVDWFDYNKYENNFDFENRTILLDGVIKYSV